MASHFVCAFYKFVHLDDHESLRDPLLSVMHETGTAGTILLAAEGINGTISGNEVGVTAVLDWIKGDPRFVDLHHKGSVAEQTPFHRTKVKLKAEIVTLGVKHIDPASFSGTYVEPEDWNELISDPEVLVVDTRNEYEVRIGTFLNAVNPGTSTFRELPEFVKQNLDRDRHKKIAMYCTGGIRCEKSTAFLKLQGFEQVYHLRGGILNYLEKVPVEDSLWEGECFVFDDRVSVNHSLDPGQYEQCHACRNPVSAEDRSRPEYRAGISCPHCVRKLSSEQVERFSEREKQVQLARKRGEFHIGEAARQIASDRKLRKSAQKQQQRERSRIISAPAK
jgi:UPF0176 protein